MRKTGRDRARPEELREPQRLATYEEFLALLLGGPPNPTQLAFINSTEHFKAFMGAAGSAKTTAGCAAILMRALFLPGSKWLIARNDYNKLITTTYETFDAMFRKLPAGVLIDRSKSPPMRMWVQPIGGGEPSQITWMGLKDNLGSIEINGAFVDEADDCDPKKILELDTRLRYKGGHHSLMIAFNPPDTVHGLYPLCTGLNFRGEKVRVDEQGNPKPVFTMFTPQFKENARNLPDRYYESREETLPADLVARLVRGEWGVSFAGTPVFPQFKARVHARPLEPSRYDQLVRFWDFGYRHPACLWAQVDPSGRLLILDEILGTNIEAAPFIAQVKARTAKFAWRPDVMDIGDVAARQHKDTGSTLAVINREGIRLRAQRMNIDPSIRATRRLFERLIDGEPAIQVDSVKCPFLIRALQGGYRMADDGVLPEKDGFYDNIVDPLRYGVVGLFGMAGRTQTVSEVAGQTSIEYRRDHDPALIGQSGQSGRANYGTFGTFGKKGDST